jgi:uncharacterized protein YhjY with autotransporter beta-barrel domain
MMKLYLFIASVSAFNSPVAFRSRSSSTSLFGEYGASSTSFYTTAKKESSYSSLDEVLDTKMADPKVRQVIKDMLDACASITEALRTALVTVEGSSNTFGDAQLSVDVRQNDPKFFVHNTLLSLSL